MERMRWGVTKPRSSLQTEPQERAPVPPQRRPAPELPPALRRRTEQGRLDVARPRVALPAAAPAHRFAAADSAVGADRGQSSAGPSAAHASSSAPQDSRADDLLAVHALTQALENVAGRAKSQGVSSAMSSDPTADRLKRAFDGYGQLHPKEESAAAASVYDMLERLESGGGEQGKAAHAAFFSAMDQVRGMHERQIENTMRVVIEASRRVKANWRTGTTVFKELSGKFDTGLDETSLRVLIDKDGTFVGKSRRQGTSFLNRIEWLKNSPDAGSKAVLSEWAGFIGDTAAGPSAQANWTASRDRTSQVSLAQEMLDALTRMDQGEKFQASFGSSRMRSYLLKDGGLQSSANRVVATLRADANHAELADRVVALSSKVVDDAHRKERDETAEDLLTLARSIESMKAPPEPGQRRLTRDAVAARLRAHASESSTTGRRQMGSLLRASVAADGHSFLTSQSARAFANSVAKLDADHPALEALRAAIRKDNPAFSAPSSIDPLEALLSQAVVPRRTQQPGGVHRRVGSAERPGHAPAVTLPTRSPSPIADAAATLMQLAASLEAAPAVSLRALRADLSARSLLPVDARAHPEAAGTSSADPIVWVDVDIDQSRSGFVAMPRSEVSAMGDEPLRLDAQLRSRLVYEERMKMKPVPGHDDEFPLRDPDDASRAYAPYAGPDGRCHPNVVASKATLPADSVDVLRFLSRKSLRDLDAQALQQRFADLQDDVLREVGRLIRNSPADRPRHETRLIEAEHTLGAHENSLVGGYGLFVKRYPGEDPPTLRHGRVLGLYGGAVIETPEQEAEHRRRYGEIMDYALDIEVPEPDAAHAGAAADAERFKFISAKGHANGMAFANTVISAKGALDPIKAKRLVYDRKHLNATFVPVDVQITDKDGELRTERMAAVIALDALVDTASNPHGQVRVDYGDEYLPGLLSRLREAELLSVAMQQSPGESPPMKTEPADDPA